ncbi:hypothetical protein L6261_01910 [Candidatus Parcubacteria bacterium]|nr:hypothetical protein [Candidatus Parcubacteria bacterium]
MSKPKLNFLHICDYVSFSEGKLNILGVFKNINANSLPMVHSQMFVVSNLTLEKGGKYKQSVKIINDKNKDEVFLKDLNIEIPENKKKVEVGMITQLNDINFINYGKYKIQIFINDEMIGESEIEIIKR